MFKIESNIQLLPVSWNRKGGSKWEPLLQMKVGDSVKLASAKEGYAAITYLRSRRFKCALRTLETKEVRVWRIE